MVVNCIRFQMVACYHAISVFMVWSCDFAQRCGRPAALASGDGQSAPGLRLAGPTMGVVAAAERLAPAAKLLYTATRNMDPVEVEDDFRRFAAIRGR